MTKCAVDVNRDCPVGGKDIEEMHRELTILKKVIHGNGEPGVTARLISLETKFTEFMSAIKNYNQARLHWFLGIMQSVVVVLLVFLLDKIKILNGLK